MSAVQKIYLTQKRKSVRRTAEKTRCRVFDTVRFIEYDVPIRRQNRLIVPARPAHARLDVGEKQVVIDDDEIGGGSFFSHFHDKALRVKGTARPHACIAFAFYARPYLFSGHKG